MPDSARVTRNPAGVRRPARVVGASKSPHVLVATSQPPSVRTRWVAWSPKTPGRSGLRKNRSAECVTSRASGSKRQTLVWAVSKNPGPADVAVSHSAPSSRTGRPSSPVTKRVSRRPSWPNPPAVPPPTGSSTRIPARASSSRVSTCGPVPVATSRRSCRARATQPAASRLQAVTWVPVRVTPRPVGSSARWNRRLRSVPAPGTSRDTDPSVRDAAKRCSPRCSATGPSRPVVVAATYGATAGIATSPARSVSTCTEPGATRSTGRSRRTISRRGSTGPSCRTSLGHQVAQSHRCRHTTARDPDVRPALPHDRPPRGMRAAVRSKRSRE